MKVTPAHDLRDFECGRRHGLPEVEVMDKHGKMCGGIDQRFVGMDRFDARQRVVEELQRMGLYVDKVRLLFGICTRSTSEYCCCMTV